jgi:hypothetical protein
MSLAEIKQAAAKLPAKKQRELAAHLLALSRRSDAAFRRNLARKIDDKNPAHWISLEDAKARLLG